MLNYPKHFKISSGVGNSRYELVSFDNALISAGISNYNLLRVSSILPIACSQANNVDIKEGSALLVAYGAISSNVEGERISSAIGAGIPDSDTQPGVIMEFTGKCSALEAEKIVREMVEESMINHNIPCREILVSSAETIVKEDSYSSVISAISMW